MILLILYLVRWDIPAYQVPMCTASPAWQWFWRCNNLSSGSSPPHSKVKWVDGSEFFSPHPFSKIVHQQVYPGFFGLFFFPSQKQSSMEVRQNQWILRLEELFTSLSENQEISSEAPFIGFIKLMHHSLSFVSPHAIPPLIPKEIIIMRIIERWPVIMFLLPWLLENSV